MPKKPKSSMKKQVASLVEAELKKKDNDEEKYIMFMVQAVTEF